MSFTTFEFFLFIAAAVIIYYVIPKKLQWIWLLIISYVYYASYDISTVWMLLLTTFASHKLFFDVCHQRCRVIDQPGQFDDGRVEFVDKNTFIRFDQSVLLFQFPADTVAAAVEKIPVEPFLL